MHTDAPVYQVSDLLAVINQTLEYAYPSVTVEGEVASFKVSKGKFVFFDLKDDEGAVNCFMMVYGLRTPLEDGMRVRVIAQPRLTAWGKFSLTVRDVQPVGEGSLKRAFELLKRKLENEGLFDPSRKRPLPKLPACVGLIASRESAGYADFIKVLRDRWGGMHIMVADVQVQGIGAAEQIIRALNYFNQHASLPEVLIIARGGGSADDLAVFNDEPLVRAIAASRIPTLVGVGHEIDISLADLAADVRAATPSNAAEILVPDRRALLAELSQRERRLADRIIHRAQSIRQRADAAPQHMLMRLHRRFNELQGQAAHAQTVLRQLNPAVVLRRGYAIVRNQQNIIISSKNNNIKQGDLLTVTTAKSVIKAEVKDVKNS